VGGAVEELSNPFTAKLFQSKWEYIDESTFDVDCDAKFCDDC
jgi:hypothetical protein